jgi:phage protein D
MLDGIIDTRPYIEVDGERPEMLNALVRAVAMEEAEGGLSTVEIRLDNAAQHSGVGIDHAFEFADTETLPLGKPFRLLFPARAGEEGEAGHREIFAGRVSALEFVSDESGTPELIVHGEDALMAWRMGRRTRAFEAGPVRDLLTTLAAGTALVDPVIDYLSEETPARHQTNESDLSFLRRILADRDADAQVVGETLQIAPRAGLQRGALTLELGSTLRRVSITADLAHQRSGFSLSAWDQIAGETLRKSMATGALGPGAGRKGAEYLEGFGEAVEHFAAAPVTTADEAQALIDAVGARAARRFVVARGAAVGDPRLRVGAHLTLEGVGPRFANTYHVTLARHRFDRTDGYVTEFEAECAYFNGEIGS